MFTKSHTLTYGTLLLQLNVKKFHHVRKPMVFFILLTLILSFQKVYDRMKDHADRSSEAVKRTGKKRVEAILCQKILNSRPLGLITQDSRAGKRIHLFHEGLNTDDAQLVHKWYHEGENILSFNCPISDAICISSVSPLQARVGDWSVDVLSSNQLIYSKQFSLVP